MFDKDVDIKNENEDADDAVVSASAPLPALASATVDLASLGLAEIAYVRRALVNDVPMWTIHSAAGHPLGAAHSFEQAWTAVKQNDLEPVRVH